MLYILYVIFFLVLIIVVLGVWLKGGKQKSESSIPKVLEGPPFSIYEAVVPGSPLRLMHFISQANEINVSSSLIMGKQEIIVFTAQATKYAAERLADEIEKSKLRLLFYPKLVKKAMEYKYDNPEIDGDSNLLPAEFLIDPKGNIAIAYYGKHYGDHIKIDKLINFVANYSL